jgi:hypothetical protein
MEMRMKPNGHRRRINFSAGLRPNGQIHLNFGKGAVMNRKLSTMKSIMLTAALAAGISGLARADDSSMNLFTGDSYAYFNGGKNFPYGKPVLDNVPSTYRPTPPQHALEFQQQHFPYVNAINSNAPSTAGAVFHPHDELPSVYGEPAVTKSAGN